MNKEKLNKIKVVGNAPIGIPHREGDTIMVKTCGNLTQVKLTKSKGACNGCIAEGNSRLCLMLDACDIPNRSKEDFIWREVK